MVEKKGLSYWFTHVVLSIGVLIIIFPVWLAFVASTVTNEEIIHPPIPLIPGGEMFKNYSRALTESFETSVPVGLMLFNTTIVALGIALGKIVISFSSAFAIVFFQFPFRKIFFWLIFFTLMLPVEVRILPTYEVVANIGLLNTYSGLIFPLIASATATFLFRQFFLTVPNEIIEAAKIDGAKPMRFFIDVLIPISRVNIAALFVIMFIFGWNQYLWPILMTTDPSMSTIIMGVDMMIGGSDDVTTWPVVMAASILSMLPPIIVVLSMQKLFIRGLTDSDK